jgi:hypothetical protein
MTSDVMLLQPGILESQNAMNAVDGIEQRIRINRPDDENTRCRVSRAWDPRKDLSQCESLGFAERAGEGMAYRQPALPLREILSNRSAISFLFFWFLANFLFGAIPASLGVTDATVAWEAHIGGFLVGLLAFRWFDPPVPPFAIPR